MSYADRGLPRRVTTLSQFGGDTRGTVAIVFGITASMLMFAAGAAIDYSGATSIRDKLQRATDGADLRLCQMPGTTTNPQLAAAATKSMDGFMGGTAFKVDAVTTTSDPRSITLSTSATYALTLSRIWKSEMTELPVTATARCDTVGTPVEIALVLDTTYSMLTKSGSTSKLDILKQAATDFVNTIYSTARTSNSKIALVPFSFTASVNPTTYRGASWIDQNAKASTHWNLFKSPGATQAAASSFKNRFDIFTKLKAANSSWDWNGCFESLPYPYNVSDAAPTPSAPDSYFVPMLAPDESGDGGEFKHGSVQSSNSYIDDDNSVSGCGNTTDETVRSQRACKYASPTGAKTWNGTYTTGPNFSCKSRPLTRLTTDKSMLLNEINQLTADGNTNIHEGLLWGWRTISPNSIFADGEPYNSTSSTKIAILMTDGYNYWMSVPTATLNSFYSAYGFYKNPDGSTPNGKLPPVYANPSDDTSARKAIDAMTLETCKNMKASPNNIVIYTIGFSIPNDPIDSQGLAMLQSCASSSDKALVASSADGLKTAFQDIAGKLGALQLRLTK